jgi:hypothetical protein
MDSTAQVILVLQLLVNLGPPALYFVVLGLINSQRRPCLISSRADFVTLTVVFLPALIWPVPFLVGRGWWGLLSIGVAVVCCAFFALLPRPHAGWVVYHTCENEMQAMLRRAVRRLGWTAQWVGTAVTIPEAGLRIRFSAFPWFGSVSTHVEGIAGRPRAEAVDALRMQIERQLERRSLLPSAVGTCLVIVGVVLWVVPLWMMLRHMDAIVDLVQHLLFA